MCVHTYTLYICKAIHVKNQKMYSLSYQIANLRK